MHRVIHGDSYEEVAKLDENSIDSVVCDPPYMIGFMGKEFDNPKDNVAGDPKFWALVLRVLKPGGHLLSFGGTRTYHRMACAIEDAGFEIRDQIGWCYGSGFPKSLDVSKAIDKARKEDIEPIRRVCRALRAVMDANRIKSRDLIKHFGNCDPRLIDHWAARDTDSQPTMPKIEQWAMLRRLFPELRSHDEEVWRLNGRKGSTGDAWQNAEVLGMYNTEPGGLGGERFTVVDNTIREPSSQAKQWSGWGTALKPAWEPIVVARKPLSEPTVAANVLRWGTGGINIDKCRIASQRPSDSIEEWEQEKNLCDSCVKDAEKKTKQGTLETEESIATKSVAPTLSGKAKVGTAATSKPDTGCSDGTSAVEQSGDLATDTSLSTATSGNRPTEKSPRDSSSTTPMKTRETTELRTCISCGVRLTPDTITRVGANLGRWPSNLCHDGSDEVVGMFPETKSSKRSPTNSRKRTSGEIYAQDRDEYRDDNTYGDQGSAARFFYVAKAARKERWAYLYCDCETATIEAWQKQDQSPNEQTDSTSLERDTFEESSEDGFDSSTTSSGNEQTVLFPQDTKSTTETTIKPTTNSPTSNSSAQRLTSDSTEDVNSETEPGTSPAESVESESQSEEPTGTYPVKVGRSTGVAVPATSPLLSGKSVCGKCGSEVNRSQHPTQKPEQLMRYLCRLVTPPKGTVLDPFTGSGSTGKAAKLEGFEFIGIEKEEEYARIAEARIAAVQERPATLL